ncbi:protein SMG9 [Copidosoma floridanum]|uniref:protein SMG9 n=1 Tax=Copidosoma floridanum TaxID=29053 RepID=UPI0006C99A88|nr:protein SMG9 [Copidosoma floridanum]
MVLIMNSKKMIPIMTKDPSGKEGESRALIKVMDRPTFILKTREGENRAVSPNHRNGNKKESDSHSSLLTKPIETRPVLSPCPELAGCIKFMDENMQLCENPLEYLQDQQDFLVVGCVGLQGVGKSTIMSYLTSSYVPDIFPTQNLSHHENGTNCTNGIDFYITKNRVIYLDTQPILSGSMVDYSNFDQKKNSTDFVGNELNFELQSLQFLAFLFSVCHVIIFVQDWFVDPNLLRFLQAAEMLKPSSTTTMDQDYVEYYPHILFLHNKAEVQDFMPANIEMMKDFYNKTFSSSKLQTHSSLDMNSCFVDNQLNLFLFPLISKNTKPMFIEDEYKLTDQLKRKIHGVTRNAMTPSNLTERNWYHYVSKVAEAIKKSHLSSEYGRLMP